MLETANDSSAYICTSISEIDKLHLNSKVFQLSIHITVIYICIYV